MADSTEKTGPLSLYERAHLGLLALDKSRYPSNLFDRARQGLLPDALEVFEIAWLEYPQPTADTLARAAFEERLQVAIDIGVIDISFATDRDGCFPQAMLINRNVYREWRTTQDNLPVKSFIHLWLGATPAPAITPAEPIPPVPQAAITAATPEPILPSKPTRTIAISPIESLELFLTEIEKRAKADGVEFDRHCIPGTKEEFQQIAIAFNRGAFSKAPSTFSDYLKGVCQFEPGVKPESGKGAVIWNLFPDYKLKLG